MYDKSLVLVNYAKEKTVESVFLFYNLKWKLQKFMKEKEKS